MADGEGTLLQGAEPCNWPAVMGMIQAEVAHQQKAAVAELQQSLQRGLAGAQSELRLEVADVEQKLVQMMEASRSEVEAIGEMQSVVLGELKAVQEQVTGIAFGEETTRLQAALHEVERRSQDSVQALEHLVEQLDVGMGALAHRVEQLGSDRQALADDTKLVSASTETLHCPRTELEMLCSSQEEEERGGAEAASAAASLDASWRRSRGEASSTAGTPTVLTLQSLSEARKSRSRANSPASSEVSWNLRARLEQDMYMLRDVPGDPAYRQEAAPEETLQGLLEARTFWARQDQAREQSLTKICVAAAATSGRASRRAAEQVDDPLPLSLLEARNFWSRQARSMGERDAGKQLAKAARPGHGQATLGHQQRGQAAGPVVTMVQRRHVAHGRLAPAAEGLERGPSVQNLRDRFERLGPQRRSEPSIISWGVGSTRRQRVASIDPSTVQGRPPLPGGRSPTSPATAALGLLGKHSPSGLRPPLIHYGHQPSYAAAAAGS